MTTVATVGKIIFDNGVPDSDGDEDYDNDGYERDNDDDYDDEEHDSHDKAIKWMRGWGSAMHEIEESDMFWSVDEDEPDPFAVDRAVEDSLKKTSQAIKRGCDTASFSASNDMPPVRKRLKFRRRAAGGFSESSASKIAKRRGRVWNFRAMTKLCRAYQLCQEAMRERGHLSGSPWDKAIASFLNAQGFGWDEGGDHLIDLDTFSGYSSDD